MIVQEGYEMETSSFPEDVDALKAAMAAVLGDLSAGLSVTPLTKAQARIAYEAFADDNERAVMMPLEEARKVMWRDL